METHVYVVCLLQKHFIEGFLGSPKCFPNNWLLSHSDVFFPDLLDSPPRYLHVPCYITHCHSFLLFANNPMDFSQIQFHVPNFRFGI